MGSKKLQPSEVGAHIGKLNPKQQMFVRFLLADPDFNATAAARKAGYAQPKLRAYKLMNEPAICKHLGKAIKKRQEQEDVSDITQVRVLKELASVGFSNIQAMVDENGAIKPLHTLPDEVARAISSVDVEERTFRGGDGEPVTVVNTKVRLWNKTDALEKIAKHLGMMHEKLNIEVEAGAGMENLLTNLLAAVEGKNNVVDGKVIQEHVAQRRITDV